MAMTVLSEMLDMKCQLESGSFWNFIKTMTTAAKQARLKVIAANSHRQSLK